MASELLPFNRKTNLAVSGNRLLVPEHTARLLYISHEANPNFKSGINISISFDIFDGTVQAKSLSPDEPSTIFTAMPIRRPADIELIPRPDYYPTYAGLSAEQKWVYLNWLTDITKPINIGYVFIYYYGLERHLLNGDFDHAYDEILLLRTFHSGNTSFDAYSRSALLNSALYRKRRDRLEQLYRLVAPERFSNIELLMAHQLRLDLGVEGLMRLALKLHGVQKRYLNSNPVEYPKALSAVLQEIYNSPFFPFSSAYQISNAPKRSHVLFANISFPSAIRSPALPSIIEYAPFVEEAARILNLAHERTKQELTKARMKS